MRKAVFLDRDGTINEEVEYLDDLGDLRIIKGAYEGIRLLNHAGFKVVVITNQSGVARGFFSEEFVNQVHGRLSYMLGQRGAVVDRWLFCPHHPEVGSPPFRRVCRCRKPGIGLVEKAASELDIDVEGSFFIGDSLSDIRTAWNAGMGSILVLTGHGKAVFDSLSDEELCQIDFIAHDLLDASRWIVQGRKR